MPRKSSPRRAHRPAERSHELIYGVHAATAALANPSRQILAIQATRNMAARLQDAITARHIEPDITEPRAIDKLTGDGAVHQGICLKAQPLTLPDINDLPKTSPVVLLDQVTDPHNVGAIMRSCAAFAASALITTARHSPQGSGVLTKAASGAAEHVHLIKVTNLARAIEELKDLGFAIIGLEGSAPTTIEQTTLPGPHALILGAEDKGLRHLTRQHCDELARVNLPGPLQSLNVSNAAALALYALSQTRKEN